MALNVDQLIQKYLSIRYPYPKGNCRIARNEVLQARIRRDMQIRRELNQWPEELRKDFVQMLIAREQTGVISSELDTMIKQSMN